MIHDSRICALGEGAFWHPVRKQFFWFDILGQCLMSQDGDGPCVWRFPELVSAAAWVSEDVLLIAGERDLFLFDLITEEIEVLCDLEADKPGNRSNDGRADRQGGFWIGTMGKEGEMQGKGAIYRYYKGELRTLYPNVSIPNSMCFTPDGKYAYFSDNFTPYVMKVALDAEGWPMGEPSVFIDHTADGFSPDGAVVDALGNFVCAEWGGSRVAVYSPEGTLLRTFPFPAPHTTCPAFGGPDLSVLYCTTATAGLSPETLATHPLSGSTFMAQGAGRGLPEPRFLLD
ncbi:MAG: SMP-30/gluconolactonase/LRE family protein [Candidatus Saccharibacteria bacterium]|nr:SMP-30/gluconolactonase/LRE family protein [Pseudorhodobacter sp.]